MFITLHHEKPANQFAKQKSEDVGALQSDRVSLGVAGSSHDFASSAFKSHHVARVRER